MRQATAPVYSPERPQPKKGGAGKILALFLAVILGAGAAFGLNFALTGSLLPGAGGSLSVQSDIPTDEAGNNTVGNHMENLQSGGFVAMQGEYIFFADLAGNGELFCTDVKGSVMHRLTDFAVANLNISGNSLVFTDLAESYYLQDGSAVHLAAANPVELWDEVGEEANIHYGGNLYAITGIKDFCEGKIDYEQLSLMGLSDSDYTYQTPVISDGLIVVTTSRGGEEAEAAPACGKLDLSAAFVPLGTGGLTQAAVERTNAAKFVDGFAVIGMDDTMRRHTVAGPTQTVENVLVYGFTAYVEVRNHSDGSHIVLRMDTHTGVIKETIDAYNIRDIGGEIAFVNEADGMIYTHKPNSDQFTAMSNLKPRAGFDLDNNGNIAFSMEDTSTHKYVNVLLSKKDRHENAENEEGSVTLPQVQYGAWHTYVNPPVSMLGNRSVTSQRFGNLIYQYNRQTGQWYTVEYDQRLGPIGEGHDMDNWRNPMATTGAQLKEQQALQPQWGSASQFRQKLAADLEKQAAADNPPADPGDAAAAEEAKTEEEAKTAEEAKTEEEARTEEEEKAANDDYMPLGYHPASPGPALNALMLTLQGHTYERHNGIGGVYHKQCYEALMDYYGGELDIRSQAAEMAADLESELGISGNAESIADAIMFWLELCHFTVEGGDSMDGGRHGQIGMARVTISSRVDFALMMDKMQGIMIQEIVAYPGGQQGIAALGQEGAAQWMMEVIIKVMLNPEEYGIIDDNPQTYEIDMVYDTDVGWVVEDVNDVLDIMAFMD